LGHSFYYLGGMKALISTLSLILCVISFAAGQGSPLPLDSLTRKVTYQGVVTVPGATQAELYSRAREWFATSFGSAKGVLEMDDRESGKLIGNAVGSYNQRFMGKDGAVGLWRTINVQVKDGRFKYVITNFATGVDKTQAQARPVELALVPAAFDKSGKPTPYMASMFAGIRQSAESQVASLREAMTKPAGKSDW
jgi:hypothetical protein